MSRSIRSLLLSVSLILAARAAHAQMPPDPAPVLKAQREAMQKLARMDGEWRGRAVMKLPGGGERTLIQTERVGLALDGTLRVVEGRGHDSEGRTPFHAFAVISYDTGRSRFLMRSHAQGNSGEFEITPTDSGFVWTIPAGPMTIRYTATIRDGRWREVGVREMPGREPVPFIEMDLTRIGDSDWPDAGAVGPR